MRSIGRRHLLKAVGLGALGSLTPFGSNRIHANGEGPLRILFYIQPHGHVPSRWHMDVPYAAANGFGERSLVDLSPGDFSDVLRPLYGMRRHLLPLEGLAQTSALADLATIRAEHLPDDNDHHIGTAHTLCPQPTLQRAGTFATAGAASIDQVLATRLAGEGRFASRVYGYDYAPNTPVTPFSFIARGQAASVVHDPNQAFEDLLGLRGSPPGAIPTREQQIAALRGSVLDAVADEYSFAAARLGRDDRERLEQHRALIADLERSLGRTASCTAPALTPDHAVRQFMRTVTMAFACDLTRVATFIAPVPQPTEFGYRADEVVHGSFAHESIRGDTSCGTTFSERSEQAMTDLGKWHAGHVGVLLQELDAVREGNCTLLDRTLVVWLTELSTGTHRHNDMCTLLAGGSEVLRPGRYLRFARDARNPLHTDPHEWIGPGMNRLFVSLLHAFGFDDETFGIGEAPGADGSNVSLRGVLAEILR